MEAKGLWKHLWSVKWKERNQPRFKNKRKICVKRWKHRGGISGRAWPTVASEGRTSGEQRPPGEEASGAIRRHNRSEEGKAKHWTLPMCVLCHVSEVLSVACCALRQSVRWVGSGWSLRTSREESGTGFRLRLYCAWPPDNQWVISPSFRETNRCEKP